MKLRLRYNSIRFRLGKSEVERLHGHMPCAEAIHFPGGGALEYIVEPSTSDEITVSFVENSVRVGVPSDQLARWCTSDQVGLSGEIPVPGVASLRIDIEKDFRCLDSKIDEDQADTFDNPLELHLRCDPLPS